MRDLGDHAAGLRRIDQFGHPADLVELEPDQRFALVMRPAYWAADLLYLDGFFCVAHCVLRNIQSATAASASTSRRRACSAETLTLRRAATDRGESCRLSASNVARTTL